MKPIRIITILLLSGALFLTGCNKEKGDDTHETYSITVTSGDNGAASANVTEAEAGTTIILTATPDEGYELSTWTVTAGGVTLSPDNTSLKVTFTMPDNDVSVSVVFTTVAPDPTLSATPSDTVSFTAQAEEGENVVVTVETNQASWDVKSDQPWCKVEKNADGVTFTISAEANLDIESPIPAKVTVTAGNASPVVIDVTQDAAYAGVLINGIRWAECNVADFGTFAKAPEESGMFYQWNRTKAWPVTGDAVDWDASFEPGEEWDDDKDPCPKGWRIPTRDEQMTLLDDPDLNNGMTNEWTTLNDINGYRFTEEASGNSIFLPAAGGRFFAVGSVNYVGLFGRYWSQTADLDTNLTDYAWYLGIDEYDDNVSKGAGGARLFGFSIRCIRR